MDSEVDSRYRDAMDELSDTQLFLELATRLAYMPLTKGEYMLEDDTTRWDRNRLLQDLIFVEENRNSCGGFTPVVDSARLETLLMPNKTCAEMFRAARALFGHRKWRRKDYQRGGFWRRGKLCLDLAEKANVKEDVVDIALNLDSACIFSAVEETQSGMRRSDYQHGGVWNREKLIDDIAAAMEPVVDSSFHVEDLAQGDEPFEDSEGSEVSDVLDFAERFEDVVDVAQSEDPDVDEAQCEDPDVDALDDDEAQSEVPDAEHGSWTRSWVLDRAPPGHIRGTRPRGGAWRRFRRPRHPARRREAACRRYPKRNA